MPRLFADHIAQELRRRIASGLWSLGERIPPERDLANEFGVARNTVRRAVGLLADDGLVVRHVGRGTFLARSASDMLAGAIARMEGAGPADIMEIRRLLEPPATAFAATNASAAELAEVRDAHLAAVNSTDLPAFEHWDAEFHERIFACSRNELLREIHNLVRILRNRSPWFEIKKRSFSEERRRKYCHEHQAIIDALVDRDARAARDAMFSHLRTVAKNLLGDRLTLGSSEDV